MRSRSVSIVVLLLGRCPLSAARIDPRNHEFNDNTAVAEEDAFNHSYQALYDPSIGLLAGGGPAGALLCPDGVCIDGSCCGKNGKCGFEPENCAPGYCTSNCDAKAMCGRRSKSGKQPCGMNLCCSWSGWCGYESVHCQHADGWGTAKGAGDCQSGMGYCGDPAPMMPKVHAGSSSSKRKIGYWQSSNIHKRQFHGGKFKCPPVRPGDIPLGKGPLGGGWTHLYYAFGAINPTTFKIVDDPTKQDLYREFTGLKFKANGPQTWIAIGGFDFSDPGVDPDAETDTAPGVSTHNAWSNMASTAANRKVFIDSLFAFMDNHGFQGVDLDWEYPVAEDRGGTDADEDNFVSLVREMRTTFGTRYGISVALAPDIWYLRYYNAKAMQQYVDWFGFMAYDLHGVWASDSRQKKVKGQTDADEIYKDIIPLSFAGLDFNKINFGMALYGRGFKLADPKCTSMDGSCAWTAGSEPGECTSFSGVLSFDEILQKVASAKRLGKPGPVLDSKTMMKLFTWGQNQENWIGYDDADTWELKKNNLADKYGFGGTMFWSVDFLGQGANTSDVYLDPAAVCHSGGNRAASCHPPCRFIMPQCEVATTTVTATYTISVEVYDGPSSTSTTTLTTAVTVTTNSVSFEPVYVGGGRTSGEVFSPVTVVPMPSIAVSITRPGGEITTRVAASQAAPCRPGRQNFQKRRQARGGAERRAPPNTVPTASSKTATTSTSSTTTVVPVAIVQWPPHSIQFTDDDSDDGHNDKLPCNLWFFSICIQWGKLKIKAIKFTIPIPQGRFIWPPPPGVIDPPPGISLSLHPTPQITLTHGKDNKWTTPQPNQEDNTASCRHSTTVYDQLVSVTETVHMSGTKTFTSTSTVFSTQVPRSGCDLRASSTATTTTTSRVCTARPKPSRVVVGHIVDLGLTRQRYGREDGPASAPFNASTVVLEQHRNDTFGVSPPSSPDTDSDCEEDIYGILIPRDPYNVDVIDRLLHDFRFRDGTGDHQLRYTKISAPSHRGFTGGYFLQYFTDELEEKFAEEPYKSAIFAWDGNVEGDAIHTGSGESGGESGGESDGESDGGSGSEGGFSSNRSHNRRFGSPVGGTGQRPSRAARALRNTLTVKETHGQKREAVVMEQSVAWELSQISVARDIPWKTPQYQTADSNWKYYMHESAGAGQTVYVIEARGVVFPNHPEYAAAGNNVLDVQVYGDRVTTDTPEVDHASEVAAKAVGHQLGLARKASLWSGSWSWDGIEYPKLVVASRFRVMEVFVRVLEHVAASGRGGSSVVNFSWADDRNDEEPLLGMDEAILGVANSVMSELNDLGVVIVMAAGNNATADPPLEPSDHWPQSIADRRSIANEHFLIARDEQYLEAFAENIIIVGATTDDASRAKFSEECPTVGAYAPGARGWTVDLGGSDNIVRQRYPGTSYAAPLVAGLVAYFRALPNPDLQQRLDKPKAVKWLVRKLSRHVHLDTTGDNHGEKPTIWNGQLPEDVTNNERDLSCLVPDDIRHMTDRQWQRCPDIANPRFWTDWNFWRDPNARGRPGGDGDGIRWSPGDPGPACTPGGATIALHAAESDFGPVLGPGQCGVACNADWYCDSWPDGPAPFYYDPLDPNNPYKDGHDSAYNGSGPISPGGHGSNEPTPSKSGLPPHESGPSPVNPPRPPKSTPPSPPPSSPPPPPAPPANPQKKHCLWAMVSTETNAILGLQNTVYFGTLKYDDNIVCLDGYTCNNSCDTADIPCKDGWKMHIEESDDPAGFYVTVHHPAWSSVRQSTFMISTRGGVESCSEPRDKVNCIDDDYEGQYCYSSSD